jgi:cytochrome c-type biogenesis protein CcmH/NrfF
MTLESLVLWMPAIVIVVAGIFFAATVLPKRKAIGAGAADGPSSGDRKKIIADLDRDARELRQISHHVEDARRALTTS